MSGVRPATILLGALLMPVAVPSAEIPESLRKALQVVGSVQEAVAQSPVLTGTEGFDLEAFRQLLRDIRGDTPYSDFLTAESVEAFAAGAGTYSGFLAYFDVGWAALEVNWAVATLLGEGETAATLAQESQQLLSRHPLYVANVTGQAPGQVFAAYFPRYEASGLAMLLRQAAAQASLAAYLPDAADPEGHVRSRLRGLFDRLTNSADLIRDAGEAYSPY